MAADVRLAVLEATRPHIELYRTVLEQRGLAASTIDRRLSTVCGFYRFAHIDGRVASRRSRSAAPPSNPSAGHGMDRAQLGTFLFTTERFDRDHAALAVLLGLNGLRVSEACATNIADLRMERGHRTLWIIGMGSKPAVVLLVPRTARTIDLAVGERREGPILRRRDEQRLDRRTAHRRVALSVRAPPSARCTRTCSAPRSSWPLDAGVPRRDVQIAPVTPTCATPPSTTAAPRTSTGTLPTSSSRSSPAADRPRHPRAAPQ